MLVHVLTLHSTSEPGKSYRIEINTEEQTVRCDCKGFQVHKRCKHIRFYKPRIKAILKSGKREDGKPRSSSA